MVLDDFLNGTKAYLWLVGKNKDIEFAAPKVMAVNL